MFDIITIGSATLDVFLRCSHLHINTHLSEDSGENKEMCLPFGKKIEVDDVLFATGGGGTNSAVTFARQGLKVAAIAKIGKDFACEKVLQELNQENVNTSFLVQDPNTATDFSTILWAPNFGTTILVYRGKSRLELTEIPFNQIQTKWVYVSSTEGNIELMTNVKLPALPAGRQMTNVKIAWNPGRKELEQKEKLIAALANVELLMLNREEVSELLGEQESTDIQPLLAKAQTLQCKSLIVTAGHSGSYYYSNGKWLHAGVFTVDRVETTGAGDSFGSAFVAGKIKGLSDDQCLKMASANAASVVSRPGAKRGILKQEEINEWLNKDILITNVNL